MFCRVARPDGAYFLAVGDKPGEFSYSLDTNALRTASMPSFAGRAQ